MNQTVKQPTRVPGHKRRLYTDEQLAESVKQPVPDWCNVKLQIAQRREPRQGIPANRLIAMANRLAGGRR